MMWSSEELGFLTVMAASAGLTFLVLIRQKLFQPKLSQDSSVKRGDPDVNYPPVRRRPCPPSSAKNHRDGEKKVRFAGNVAESSTDNGVYRKRRGPPATRRTRRPAACEGEENIEACSSNPLPPAKRANSRRTCSGVDADKASTARQTVAKPNIPANRLALYKGILQYRSQRAASIYIDSLDE